MKEILEMAEEKVYPMTPEGKKQLEDELEELKTVKRGEIIERIKIARGFGDLSENSEYESAKDEQAFVEGRITTIEEEEEYKIVGSAESDPFSGKISNDSPIAQALIGKRKGDKVTIEIPNGNMDVEIVSVKES